MLRNPIRSLFVTLLFASALFVGACGKRESKTTTKEIPEAQLGDLGPITSPRGNEVAGEVKKAIQENGSGDLAQPNALVDLIREAELPAKTPALGSALTDKVQNFLDIDESKLEGDDRGEYIAQALALFGALAEKAGKDAAPLMPLPGESYLGVTSNLRPQDGPAFTFRFVGRYANGVTIGDDASLRGATKAEAQSQDREIPEGDLTGIRFYRVQTKQEYGVGEPMKDGSLLMKFIYWPQWPATLVDTQEDLRRGVESNIIGWTKRLVQTDIQDPVQRKTAELYRRLGTFVRLGVLLMSPTAKKFLKQMPRPVAQLLFQRLYGIELPMLTGENR